MLAPTRRLESLQDQNNAVPNDPITDDPATVDLLASASYKAVLPTLTRPAASRTFNPSAISTLARASFSGVTTALRPPLRRRAQARACAFAD